MSLSGGALRSQVKRFIYSSCYELSLPAVAKVRFPRDTHEIQRTLQAKQTLSKSPSALLPRRTAMAILTGNVNHIFLSPTNPKAMRSHNKPVPNYFLIQPLHGPSLVSQRSTRTLKAAQRTEHPSFLGGILPPKYPKEKTCSQSSPYLRFSLPSDLHRQEKVAERRGFCPFSTSQENKRLYFDFHLLLHF